MVALAVPPVWLQNGTYPARVDRQLVDVLWTEGVIYETSTSLKVTQRGAGPNNSCDVAVGRAIITGDNISYQGKYLAVSETIVNVPFSAAPVAGTRIDLLYLIINDPTSGGGAGDNADLAVAVGPGGATVPATPSSAIPLATVLRTVGDVSITNSMITDVRTFANPGAPPNDAWMILAQQVFS